MSKIKLTLFLVFLTFLLGNMPTSLQAATSLYVGQSTILSAPDPPSGAALNQTAWGCSNAHVSVEKYMTYGAKVTVNSYFTGTADIRCDYYYYWYDNYGYMHTNNATTYYQITCNPVTLSISPTSMSLYPEEGKTISYSYSPSNVSPKPTIRFLSSNTNVATVNDNGYVRAVGSGTATITVENNAGPNAICSVNVKEVEPTGISLPDNLTLEVDESKTIPLTIYPSYAKKSLTWSSSDETIATVSSSGSVYGKKKGTVKISVKTHNGYSDYCDIVINDHKLTISASPKGGLVDDGTKVTLTADKSTANIFYTLNGSVPTANSSRYSSPIVLHEDVTIKAIAVEERFVSSDVLMETYRIASLDVDDLYPKKEAEDVSPYTIPYIKFNQQILEGNNFGNIKLIKNGIENISAECLIDGNIIWIIPKDYFEIGASYKIDIPENAVITATDVPCKAFTSVFSVYPYAQVITMAQNSGAIIKSDGSLWMWGKNSVGELGNGTTTYCSTAVKIMDDVKSVSLGVLHSVVLKNDGSVWTAGFNVYGQLGNGSKTNSAVFTKIMSGVTSISADQNQSFALKTNGTLWAWGNNYYGQLGDGGLTAQSSPIKVLDNVAFVEAGYSHTAAIKNDGSLYLWGDNSFGEVGGYSWGGDTRQATPRKVSVGLSNYTPVSAALGSAYTVILSATGQVAVCGYDGHGQNGGYGNGTTFRTHINNVKKISAGTSGHIAAIKNDGSLYMWGNNDDGQLGDYTKSDRKSPVYITNNVIDVCAGYHSTAIIKTDGSVWTWGRAENYVLGDGSTSSRSYPVKIMEGKIELANLSRITMPQSATLKVGQRSVLPLALLPTSGKISSQYWISSDEKIIQVSPRGVITAISEGTATITTTINGSITATCEITAERVLPQNITLPETATIKVGESVTLTPTLLPHNATANIMWKSSDESVATVAEGNVTARNTGKTIIEATTDNGLFATCEIIVNKGSVSVTADTESGIYAFGKMIVLKANRIDAEIYYTLDGSTPSTSSTRYIGPITLTQSVTLKAIATGSNYETSSVLTRSYQITTLTMKNYWDETVEQSPFFIPAITYSKAVNKSISISGVKLQKDGITINGQSIVQDGILYFVPDSKLDAGTYTLMIPENAIMDSNDEPNYATQMGIMIGTAFNHVTSILLPHNTRKMTLESKYLILPTMTPESSSAETIEFTSSKPQVATVSARGIVEAKAIGKTTITVTIDGKYTARCEVEVKEREMDVVMSATGYATFYDSQSAFSLPNGLSAQVVSGVSNSKITYQKLTSNVVPKNVPVMLTNDEQQAGTYTLTASESTATYSGTNLLHGSDEATTTTGDGYHYKLSYGKTETTWSDVFGWYWGAQDGAPFQIDGHKAWLVVPNGSTRAAGFTIDGDATEIIGIESDNEAHDIYYDMQGRRIGTPTRTGLYIKNGKKVIIK